VFSSTLPIAILATLSLLRHASAFRLLADYAAQFAKLIVGERVKPLGT
jgi:hypothetical protein